jgi:uncharacterized protein (DUF305 family)
MLKAGRSDRNDCGRLTVFADCGPRHSEGWIDSQFVQAMILHCALMMKLVMKAKKLKKKVPRFR